MTDNECCICLESINDVNVAITECGHKFHTSCLMKCKNECPLCRKTLVKEPQNETRTFNLNQSSRTVIRPVTNDVRPATNDVRPAEEGGFRTQGLAPPEDLSPEQQRAYNMYQAGKNVFITGPGGAGKSYLIRKIKDDLEAREQKHAVCALTGCAAVLLNCCAKNIH